MWYVALRQVTLEQQADPETSGEGCRIGRNPVDASGL